MTNLLRLAVHKLHRCGSECEGCVFCQGGLALCTVCGGGEASLPTDCPGERMSNTVQDAVQAGAIDYRRRDGWIQQPVRIWGSELGSSA